MLYSTERQEYLFQGNFANTHVRRDLWRFMTKIKKFSSLKKEFDWLGIFR